MKRTLGRAALYLAVLALAAVVAMPMYWLVVSAFKASDEIFTPTPRWLPADLEWQNFVLAWQGAAFGRYFVNSVFVVLAILLLQLATSSLAAFALARRRFAGRGIILLVVIGALIIPIQVTFLANFITLQRFGWLDSYLGADRAFCRERVRHVSAASGFPRRAASAGGRRAARPLHRAGVPVALPAAALAADRTRFHPCRSSRALERLFLAADRHQPRRDPHAADWPCHVRDPGGDDRLEPS